jgi:acetyltransferase-like isoleucine patch superfamily enzyme
MRALWFYIRFFLKGGYINSFSKLKFSPTSWIGKSVSIFFETSPGKQKIILGEGVRIGHFSDLYVGTNNVITIRDFSTLNTHCKIAGDVTIERYCLLSANILISSGAHYATKFPHLLIRHQDAKVLSDEQGLRDHSKPVHIEEDVWIGFGVYIKQGLTIGRGAVIGANSVVLKDVMPYEIVAGNPAKKIKSRFEFVPGTEVDASNEFHLPYFYRGFDHYNVSSKNPSGKAALLAREECCIATFFVTDQWIVFSGFSLESSPFPIEVVIDGYPAGKFEITAPLFEIRLRVENSTFLKRTGSKYSFINFVVPLEKGLRFGINRLKLVDSI